MFRVNKSVKTTLLAATLVILFAAPAFAEEHEGGFPLGQVVAAVVNFVLFIAILVKVSKAGVSSYYKTRADELNEAVRKANEALANAQHFEKEAADRLARAEIDADELLENARTSASRQGEEAIRSAEAKAERILTDAQATISAETKRLVAEMKQDLSEKVVEIARERINRTIDPSAQSGLIRDYLAKVEEV